MAGKAADRRARLDAAAAAIEARIAALESEGPFSLVANDLGHACGRPGSCQPCLHADLEHLWDSSTIALDSLKMRLALELAPSWCPYCGIDSPHTFDHYLPKSVFPEFSVSPINLIWSCERCNLLKLDLRPEGGWRCLHPAIDPLDRRLLRCELDMSAEPYVAVFKIDAEEATASGLLDECGFHFRRLQLADRLSRAANDLFANFIRMRRVNGLPVDRSAAEMAQTLAEARGGDRYPNDYGVLVYLAIAAWLESLPEGAAYEFQ